MKRFKDKLDKQLQAHMSLNFLMSERQEISATANKDIATDVWASEESNASSAMSSIFDNEMFETYHFHKYISRTFDIGKCRKIR